MDINTQQVPIHGMEVHLSSEQAEKRLSAILTPLFRMKGESEEFLRNNLRIKQIMPNVFVVGTERVVSMFCDEKWEVILNLKALRRGYYFEKAWFVAWYREIPSDTGPVNLYHIQDIDDKGNPIPSAKPIDKYSREYHEAFVDIAFYDDRLLLETFKKKSSDTQTYTPIDKEFLSSLTMRGAMRIRDLVMLNKQWQVTESDYKSTLSTLQNNLLSSVGNRQFERVNQGIKREELDSYLKDGLISKDLHTQAIQKLERVEKIKREIGKKHSEITNQTQIKTAWLMNESQNVA